MSPILTDLRSGRFVAGLFHGFFTSLFGRFFFARSIFGRGSSDHCCCAFVRLHGSGVDGLIFRDGCAFDKDAFVGFHRLAQGETFLGGHELGRVDATPPSTAPLPPPISWVSLMCSLPFYSLRRTAAFSILINPCRLTVFNSFKA